MKNRWPLILCLFGLAGAAPLPAGCKHVTCESVCEERNACDSAMKTPDCTAACAADVQNAVDTGCKTEYDSLLSCEGQGAVDVCTADTFCTGQSAAYYKCVSDACMKDPSKCSGS